MDIKKIRQLAKLLEQENLTELETQDGDFYIRLKKADNYTKTEPPVYAPKPETPETPREETVTLPDTSQVISSPLSGFFYRSKSPGMPPFVNVGDVVAKGKTLCILEAMKLMNELEAPEAGKIVEVLAENGQTVTDGQPLFRYIPE